ncbi:MAG: signal peptidase II [Candidatus Ornithomonoglobus sp.]
MNKKKFIASSVLWLIAAAVITLLDQLMKLRILRNYTPGTVFGGIPGVADFLYVKNTGAAFSILSGNTSVLSIISVLFCIAVIVYWVIKKPSHPMLCLAAALLFAGALGNAVDRVAYGFVVDFIAIKWFSFPVFNIADMAIVGGAAAAVIYVLLFDKDDTREKKNG